MAQIRFNEDNPLPKQDTAHSVLVTSTISGTNTYTVATIHGIVGPSRTLQTLLAVLTNATKGDKVDIIIDSPGGHVSTGIIIMNAIMQSSASVKTIAQGDCASIACCIWSVGDELEAQDWSEIMVHMSSHGARGNSKAIELDAQQIIRFMEFIFEYQKNRGLFTEEEIDRVCNNKLDLYLTGTEMQERLKSIKSSGKEL